MKLNITIDGKTYEVDVEVAEADHAGLPPAYIAVAGFDVLRDEGIAYAEKLRAAGVSVTLRVHTDAVHPMLTMLAAPLGRRVLAETAIAVRAGLHRSAARG